MSDVPSDFGGHGDLGPADAAELAGGVAELTKAGLPLPAGLRALAEELRGRRLRGALGQMADRIERGEPFGTAIDSVSENLPLQLQGLLQAGIRSGRLPEVLEEYVQVEHNRRQLRQSLQLSLAYPTLLAIMITAIAVFTQSQLAPELARLYRDFKMSVPFFTQVSQAFLGQATYLYIAISVVLTLVPILLSDLPGVNRLAPLTDKIPFIGPLMEFSRLASLSRIIAILLRNQTSLPEALRLAASGTNGVYLAKACRDAADEVERGRPLSEAVADRPQFPRNMIPMLAWGQQTNALPEAFVAVAQMYESRAESQKQLIQGVVIPLTFLMVFAMVGSVFAAVITPLVSLIYYFMGMVRMVSASVPGSSSSLIPMEFGFSGMFSPIILGTALLITKRLITFQHDPSNENVVEMGLKITGWVLIAVGVAGNFLCVMGFLSIFWWIALAFVAIMVWLKQRRARQKALLGAMAASTERFIPLAPTIEAFASDMRGRIGNRAARLADLLKNGIPLPDALRRVKRAVPSDSIPIVRAGYESGAFAQGLREAALAEDVQPALWGSLAGKMLYLTAVPPIAIGILGFVATKVVPSFRSIFKDSDLQFSGFTRGLFAAFGWLEHIWPVFPFLIFGFACLFFYCLLRSCGIPLFELPGMERIMRRKHTALILDSLALAVEHGRPLFNAFCSLAECYPKSSIRRRLNDAAYDLQQGVPWSASLYRRGLIRQSDWAVLKAAERAGNLVWAMRELAAGNRRRLAYRMEVLVQMLFPPVVLCFGAIVLFVVVALFVPLVTLIQRMS